MGDLTYYKRHHSSLALTVILISLSLMCHHGIHVVARHLIETSLSKDYPEVPDTEVPDDPVDENPAPVVPDDPVDENPAPVLPDDPVDENPAPVLPQNPFLPQPDYPEVPGDLPEQMSSSPELPLPTFPTISTQAMTAKP
ncbi:hypothetical protein BVRB_8g195120 [Beta vulgaris subsp. vulgaris]|uniref:vegetative cell wall protein gp1 n=1 Tax=Beta vulgaris subsp. vulgaris TaxID=3555 RepID=UPI00053FDEB4|nr:vegetative cell wall protein gp1 [Beta vulgaris subsp. vulgaris]KMT02938.1 hypothetical protein BVRB_8g195120 [Beta vulgaris subsp. vulgaris]